MKVNGGGLEKTWVTKNPSATAIGVEMRVDHVSQ